MRNTFPTSSLLGGFSMSPFVLMAGAALALLVGAGILYAEKYVAGVVSSGAESDRRFIMNVGQTAIGRSAPSNSSIAMHVGVVPIYVYSMSGDVPGDCTGNGIVNLDDYEVFVDCITGPDGGLLDGCGCADLDGDLDVDLRDAGMHMELYGPSS